MHECNVVASRRNILAIWDECTCQNCECQRFIRHCYWLRSMFIYRTIKTADVRNFVRDELP